MYGTAYMSAAQSAQQHSVVLLGCSACCGLGRIQSALTRGSNPAVFSPVQCWVGVVEAGGSVCEGCTLQSEPLHAWCATVLLSVQPLGAQRDSLAVLQHQAARQGQLLALATSQGHKQLPYTGPVLRACAYTMQMARGLQTPAWETSSPLPWMWCPACRRRSSLRVLRCCSASSRCGSTFLPAPHVPSRVSRQWASARDMVLSFN